MARLAHRELNGRVLGQLYSLQATALAAGLLLFFHRALMGWAGRVLVATRLSWLFRERPDCRMVLGMLPLAAVMAGFDVAAVARSEIPIFSPLTLSVVLWSTVFSVTLFALIATVLRRLTHWRFTPVLVALPWAALVSAEAAIHQFSNMHLEAQHLRQINWAFIRAFISPGTVALVGTGVTLCLASGGTLCLPVGRPSWKTCGRLLALLAAIWLLNGPKFVFWISSNLTPYSIDRAILAERYSALRRIQCDPVIHLMGVARESMKPPPYRKVSDFSSFIEPIAHWQLPLRDERHVPLGQSPFRRVVLIFTESFSGYYLRSLNRELPGTVTPFLDSAIAGGRGHANYRTSAQPTIHGLAVTLCSHPNPVLLVQCGFPQSMAGVVSRDDWLTLFVSSSSKYFESAERLMTAAGFAVVQGMEDFGDDPRHARYVSEWGVCDRIMLQRAAELLRAHRDRKVLLALLGSDTHLPVGRRDYCGLEYPPTPGWVAQYPGMSGLLRSVFRSDCDLKRFIDDLERDGLMGEDTLVVITADHCLPTIGALSELPGASKSPFERIPLILLSKRALPAFDAARQASQLDLAPTLLHLLGLPVPPGYWGRSLFDTAPPPVPFIGIFNGRVTVLGVGVSEHFELCDPGRRTHRELAELLHVYRQGPDLGSR